jgi:hypothetical protein
MIRRRWVMPLLFDKAAITFRHLRRQIPLSTIADRARRTKMPAGASTTSTPSRSM